MSQIASLAFTRLLPLPKRVVAHAAVSRRCAARYGRALTTVAKMDGIDANAKADAGGVGAYDRQNAERIKPGFVDAQLQRPDARYLAFDAKLNLLAGDLALRWLSSDDVGRVEKDADAPMILLGCDDTGAPLCAVRLSAAAAADSTTCGSGDFSSLRDIGAMLSRRDATAAAHARSLFAFHAAHKYCGLCGAPTSSEQGGARRRCTRAADGCKGVWYPRVDPAVIALVVHPDGERVLLGRQPRHPPGMYSCLAGHMEHGEAAVDAVRREVHEEAGIRLRNVRYFASQPWPFPYTLMLGVIAHAATTHITLDRDELEDARWVTRNQLADMVDAREGAMQRLRRRRAPASSKAVAEHFAERALADEKPTLFVPPRMAIAGQLIDAYLSRHPLCKVDSISAASEGNLTGSSRL